MRRLEQTEEEEGVVEVLSSDGGREQFDLVVSADGQWSHTRKMTLGPGARISHRTNRTIRCDPVFCKETVSLRMKPACLERMPRMDRFRSHDKEGVI